MSRFLKSLTRRVPYWSSKRWAATASDAAAAEEIAATAATPEAPATACRLSIPYAGGTVDVSADVAKQGTVWLGVSVGGMSVSLTEAAGWLADRDDTAFQRVTGQRADPITICSGRAVRACAAMGSGTADAALHFSMAASTTPTGSCPADAITTWDYAARDGVALTASAILAAALARVPAADTELQAALQAALAEYAARSVEAGGFVRHSQYHAAIARELALTPVGGSAGSSPLSITPPSYLAASTLAEPRLWLKADAADVVADSFKGSIALLPGEEAPTGAAALSSSSSGATDSSSAAAGCDGDVSASVPSPSALPPTTRREVLTTLARNGFAVVRDHGFLHGVDASLQAAQDTPLGSVPRALAAPSPDRAERLLQREAGIAALSASLFGVIRNTHYSAVTTWGDSQIIEADDDQRSAAASGRCKDDAPEHLDTAYVKVGIGLHTDSTYFAEAVAVQVFGCLHRCPALSRGGESEMADGFAVAAALRREDRKLYEALATTPVVATYCKEGRAFTGCRPVISRTRFDDRVVMITYNPYDRAPMPAGILGVRELDAFYAAYERFGHLAAANATRFQLETGDVLLFNNHRMLHARTGFSGPRVMSGCYIGTDDVTSAFVDLALRAP